MFRTRKPSNKVPRLTSIAPSSTQRLNEALSVVKLAANVKIAQLNLLIRQNPFAAARLLEDTAFSLLLPQIDSYFKASKPTVLIQACYNVLYVERTAWQGAIQLTQTYQKELALISQDELEIYCLLAAQNENELQHLLPNEQGKIGYLLPFIILSPHRKKLLTLLCCGKNVASKNFAEKILFYDQPVTDVGGSYKFIHHFFLKDYKEQDLHNPYYAWDKFQTLPYVGPEICAILNAHPMLALKFFERLVVPDANCFDSMNKWYYMFLIYLEKRDELGLELINTFSRLPTLVIKLLHHPHFADFELSSAHYTALLDFAASSVNAAKIIFDPTRKYLKKLFRGISDSKQSANVNRSAVKFSLASWNFRNKLDILKVEPYIHPTQFSKLLNLLCQHNHAWKSVILYEQGLKKYFTLHHVMV